MRRIELVDLPTADLVKLALDVAAVLRERARGVAQEAAEPPCRLEGTLIAADDKGAVLGGLKAVLVKFDLD